MIDDAELEKVVAAIDKEDPESEDEQLQAMRDALRFAQGYEGTAAEFIHLHIEED